MPTEKQLADAARAEARAEFETPKDAIALAKRMAKVAGKVKPQQMAEAAYMLVCCAAMAKDPQGYMDWIAAVGDLPAAAPKPLTDDEIAKTRRELPFDIDIDDLPEPWAFLQGFRAAERAHGIKEQA